MSDFSIILDHPDSKEIISKLISGGKPKEISQWLKIKYSDKSQSHLRLSQRVLKEFADSQYTQFHDQFKQDMQIVAEGKIDKKDTRMSAALSNNKFYRQRMEEVQGREIQFLDTLEMIAAGIHQRMEQIFDLTQQDPTSINQADNVLNKYVTTFTATVTSLLKLKAESPDFISQQNYTAQTINEYIGLFQDCIRETLTEIDPELVNVFMDKLYKKLNELKPPKDLSQEERLNKAQVIKGQILSVE